MIGDVRGKRTKEEEEEDLALLSEAWLELSFLSPTRSTSSLMKTLESCMKQHQLQPEEKT